MSANDYLEDFSSLIPAIQLLNNLGYEYLPPSEALQLRGGKKSNCVLTEVLEKKLQEINSFEFKGNKHKFSEGNIKKAVSEISKLPFDSLMTNNEKIYDLLTLGKSFEETIDGYNRSYSLNFIDWKNPENNVFHVSDEYEVEKLGSKQVRRPDMVLFINGIPLVVIECKRPDLKDAVVKGVSQHIRNQKKDEIPELFTYSQILFSLCQNDARYGTTDTPLKFWSLWKEDEQEFEDRSLLEFINKPASGEFKQKLFSERDEYQKKYIEKIWNSGDRQISAQDRAIYSLLRKDRLLELIFGYIVYDNGIKKVARYQQYFAIKETIKRVTKKRGDEQRQGGVIWHTTGSGKSLTMVMLAKALVLEESIINPKVILVTDRVDLDDQIYKTFKNCGKDVKKADSGKDLVDLIKNNKSQIITTVIDKFESATKNRKLKDESSNIFVLVDESHRSQYGVAHAKMQNVFPNACYIGFTGTPLLKSEKSTASKFGGFIHKYTMNQAVKDEAVTPILYEGRMSELHGEKEQLDKWFDRITKDLSDEQKLDLKKKFKREEELSKADSRIAEIAYDISEHYISNFRGTGKKGQLAVSTKQMAIKYHNLLKEFDIETAIIISAPDTRENHSSTDESQIPEVQAFWKVMMDKYGNEKKYVESITNSFIKSDWPEIIIVVDKLLTGFDAPNNTVLYVDKRLKEHNILQAIARVNRLFENKDYGLVIDYRGIFGELNDAIDMYAALEREGFDQGDVENTLIDTTEEIKKLPEKLTNLWNIFSTVKNKSDIEEMQRLIAPQDIRDDFYDRLREFMKTLQIALANAKFQDECPPDKIRRHKDSLKLFLNLRQAVKQRYSESVDYSTYEKQIRNIVNKHIGADQVKQILAPVDIFKADEFEDELEKIEGDAAKADTIASRLKKTISEKWDEDPALYKKLSELISEAISEHRAKRLSDAEFLERMKGHLNIIKDNDFSDLPSSLRGHNEAKAFYGIINEELNLKNNIRSEKELSADISIRVEEIIEELKIRDWQHKQDVINNMKNEIEDYIFSIKGRYELEIAFVDIDNLMERLINTSISRELNAA